MELDQIREQRHRLSSRGRWLTLTNREQALEIAERIREAVMNLNHPNPGTNLGHVTISVGVACAARPIRVEPLLRQADEALYRAKSAGRNKVCE